MLKGMLLTFSHILQKFRGWGPPVPAVSRAVPGCGAEVRSRQSEKAAAQMRLLQKARSRQNFGVRLEKFNKLSCTQTERRAEKCFCAMSYANPLRIKSGRAGVKARVF